MLWSNFSPSSNIHLPPVDFFLPVFTLETTANMPVPAFSDIAKAANDVRCDPMFTSGERHFSAASRIQLAVPWPDGDD